MPQIDVRPIQGSDLNECAALLAARHASDMQRVRNLDPHLMDPLAAKAMLEPLLANPLADAAVALRGETVIGFVFGERMYLPPRDFAAQFVPPYSVSIPIEGHAVTDGEDALSVYRALYAHLARLWVDAGLYVHRIAIVPRDADLQEAWVTLGFGRVMSAATRETSLPVRVSNPRAITIERASPEDMDDVQKLADVLNSWHWQSPMFWPIVGEAQPAAREFNLHALRSGDLPYFIAYDSGNAVAMQSFLKPGFTPPIVKRDSDVYLFEGVVDDSARGGGIGATLLQHSLAWAHRSGYETCTLHFASGNPSGAPFWLSHGFEPVEHAMERRIDPRVAFARP